MKRTRKLERVLQVSIIALAVFLVASAATIWVLSRADQTQAAGEQPAAGEESLAAPQTAPEEPAEETMEETEPAEETMEAEQFPQAEEPAAPLPGVSVSSLTFSRESSQSIRLSWSDETDPLAAAYTLLRREAGGGEWVQVAQVPSDGRGTGESHTVLDPLPDARPHQYQYRVDVTAAQPDQYAPESGNEILASNILICIDPGHYKGAAPLSGENIYGYEEGTFTLRLGLALREILRTRYGIDSRMTREGDSITLGGWSNYELDHQHLALRGEYAAGCDLFLSLHTNANLSGANGYPTCNQPVSINKTLVFLNTVAAQSGVALTQANAVGENVTAASVSRGITTTNAFVPAGNGKVSGWSDAYNDALNTPGAVCLRLTERGGDYYGVLRGAANVGVPGLIVEHGHHTTEAVRRQAMQGDLDQAWAQADAAGIAQGYGFLSLG